MAYVEQQEAELPAEPVLTDTPSVPALVTPPQNHDEQILLPAIPPERGMPIWLKVTLGLVILIGLVGGIGYAMRDTLTGPPTAPPVPAPPVPAPKPPPSAPPSSPSAKPPSAIPALMPDKVKVELIAGAGRSVMISGEIVNISDAEATPPPAFHLPGQGEEHGRREELT